MSLSNRGIPQEFMFTIVLCLQKILVHQISESFAIINRDKVHILVPVKGILYHSHSFLLFMICIVPPL